ncbi:GFA family protein [Phenylobacterium sp.]|uniref:GFA family protein n=1 Tax=Phenylobacterium sp. TaxID=1871053 RepID=UPI003D275BE0
MLTGRCHCGAITYEMGEQTVHHTLCHCTDCRRSAGAPMVAWGMVPADQITIHGAPHVYASSEHGRRHFCPACGTGLFYTNDEIFPGLIDVQTATLDDPAALQPTAHIQVAERIAWMATAHGLPAFDRYPG